MKNHHHNGPIHPTSKSLIHETIATRAYELWVKSGKPDNQSDTIWLAAEQELLTGRRAPKPDLAL
jgi:Protein of unknown function (DUF2934)